MVKNEMYSDSDKWIHMDSDQINSRIPSILKKKSIRIPVFLMYSYSAVQKLKVFGFGEISTSAKTANSVGVLRVQNRPRHTCIRLIVKHREWCG